MKLLFALLIVAFLYDVMGQNHNNADDKEVETDIKCVNDNDCGTNSCNNCCTNSGNDCGTNACNDCSTKSCNNCKCSPSCHSKSDNDNQSKCSPNCKTNCCTTNCRPGCNGGNENHFCGTKHCGTGAHCSCTKPTSENIITANCCEGNCCKTHCSPGNCCPSSTDCKPCCNCTNGTPEKITEAVTSCNESKVVVHVNNTCCGNSTPTIIIPQPILPNITFGGVNVDIKTPSIIITNNPNITITHTCGNVHVSSTGNSSVNLRSRNCSDVHTDTKGDLVIADVDRDNCCQIHDGDYCIRRPGMSYVICYPKYKRHCGDLCHKVTITTTQRPVRPCMPSWPYGMCRTPCYGPCYGAYFQPRRCYGSFCDTNCHGSYC